VKNFYPPGSEVATHFTPCAIPFGCEGEDWYKFDAAAAKQMLADAGFPNGFDTKLHLRDVVRGYLPLPKEVATDIQAQLKANLNINAAIDIQESTTFIDNANAGKLDGIHMLGWGADYPDQTNFLDFHVGAGASPQFGKKFDDITAALKTGASSKEDADRQAAYTTADDALRTHVPLIPIAHGGSGVAFQKDIENAHTSPLGNEVFAVMSPGADDQFVFMQNAEPGGLYCADETDGESLRVCNQMMESLYQYKTGGTEAIPALAESCDPNTELTEWTCHLRSGVTFHDGSTLDANDVVLSYAVQWDAKHPLHKGRQGTFDYFSALFGGFLNPPPAA
jgi:ABC-type transport system substrate-binding protein